jgi:predicted TPR repeat methyltransferase
VPSAEKWDVLDLGCGAGLVGSAIAPFARQLVWVDLSAKMQHIPHGDNVAAKMRARPADLE